jgi:hypothetical protein
MSSDRTLVTELATALGMTGHDALELALGTREPMLSTVSDRVWSQLQDLHRSGQHADQFQAGFENGKAFLHAPDALAGRRPRLIEWTGGRRAPGDEVVPSDLRIDHVYIVSCKYLSRILHNPSPARLIEGLLTQAPVDDRGDWYQRTAPDEYQSLYEMCVGHVSISLPSRAIDLTTGQRRSLAHALADGWPGEAAEAYSTLCTVVSETTAKIWKQRLTKAKATSMLWRLLRIGSAPYFVLGADRSGSMRLRVETPWDWLQHNRLKHFEVGPQAGGQPRLRWEAAYERLPTGALDTVVGHIELRWSHGRFGQRPEAKVYLDTRHDKVPGYNAL